MQLCLPLLAVLLATPAARADVLVVDAAGGGDFTSLTAAVAAAANGDTLLMRDGYYLEPGPVVIDGKGLTVLGEWHEFLAETQVTVEPGLIVRNLAPGQTVVLKNLGLQGASGSATGPAGTALTLRDNTAHVRLQSCLVAGGAGLHNDNPHGGTGLDIGNSISTALVGSFCRGGWGQFSPDLGVKTGHGGTGVLLAGGQLLLSDTMVDGGFGGGNEVGGWPEGGNGGHGLLHTSGSLLGVAARLTGGNGGWAHEGGNGGHGLALGPTGIAWLMAGCELWGGEGGGSDFGPDGVDGQELFDPAGLSTNFGGSVHSFEVTSPLRLGEFGTLFLGGKPGDTTFFFASLALHQLPMPGYDGVLMLFPTAMAGPFVLGPPGDQPTIFLPPAIPGGLDVLHVHLQPAYVGGGDAVLGTGRILTLLGPGF